MVRAHFSTQQYSAERLLALPGGLPVVQIALDLDNDLTSIGSVGVDGDAVPPPLLRVGHALTGETR